MSERTFMQRWLGHPQAGWYCIATFAACLFYVLAVRDAGPLAAPACLLGIAALEGMIYWSMIGPALLIRDIRMDCPNLRLGIMGPCMHCRISHE